MQERKVCKKKCLMLLQPRKISNPEHSKSVNLCFLWCTLSSDEKMISFGWLCSKLYVYGEAFFFFVIFFFNI